MPSALSQAFGPTDMYENIASALGGRGGMPMGWPIQPGPGAVAELQNLGINIPQLQKNILFPQIAKQHPLLGGMLEGATLGAALTPPGQPVEGAGEGISRAAQGIMGVHGFRHQAQLAQIMAPFQMGGLVAEQRAARGELEFRQKYGDYLKAQAQRDVALTKKWGDDSEVRQQLEAMRQQGKEPLLIRQADDSVIVGFRDPGSPTGFNFKHLEELVPGVTERIQVKDAGKLLKGPGKSGLPLFSGGQLNENNILGILSLPPGAASPEEVRFAQQWKKNKIAMIGAGAFQRGAGSEAGGIAGGKLDPAREAYHKGEVNALDKRIADLETQARELRQKPNYAALSGPFEVAKQRQKQTGEVAGKTVLDYANIRADQLDQEVADLYRQREQHNRALASYPEAPNPMAGPGGQRSAAGPRVEIKPDGTISVQ